jgi:hypothetical protein
MTLARSRAELLAEQLAGRHFRSLSELRRAGRAHGWTDHALADWLGKLAEQGRVVEDLHGTMRVAGGKRS